MNKNEPVAEHVTGHVTNRIYRLGARRILSVYTGATISSDDDADVETGYRIIARSVESLRQLNAVSIEVDTTRLLADPGFESELRKALEPLSADGALVRFRGGNARQPDLQDTHHGDSRRKAPSVVTVIGGVIKAMKAAKAAVYQGFLLLSLGLNCWQFIEWKATGGHATGQAETSRAHDPAQDAAWAILARHSGVCHVERVELRKTRARAWIVSHLNGERVEELSAQLADELRRGLPGIDKVQVHVRQSSAPSTTAALPPRA